VQKSRLHDPLSNWNGTHAWVLSISCHLAFWGTAVVWFAHLAPLQATGTFRIEIVVRNEPAVSMVEQALADGEQTSPIAAEPHQATTAESFEAEALGALRQQTPQDEDNASPDAAQQKPFLAETLPAEPTQAGPTASDVQKPQDLPLVATISEASPQRNSSVDGHTTSPEHPVEDPMASSSLPSAQEAKTLSADTSAERSIPTELSAFEPQGTVPLPVATRTALSDYGWLQRAVLLRLHELKRTSRPAMYHIGTVKVLLRASINDRGDLAELVIVTSSGYAHLDEEAKKLVQRAFPLPLEQALGTPEVIVKIPISYSPR